MTPIKVSVILSSSTIRNSIPRGAGIYKWWCDEKMLDMFLGRIYDIAPVKFDKEGAKKCIECKIFPEYNNLKLFCIYVGQTKSSQGLHDRILKRHMGKYTDFSTLRQSIFGLKYGYFDRTNPVHRAREGEISDIINKMYVEWNECDESVVNRIERDEINRNLRIFNIHKPELDDTLYKCDPEERRRILAGVSKSRKKEKVYNE